MALNLQIQTPQIRLRYYERRTKICKNCQSLLHNHFESILKDKHLSIPGFVVLAKWGDEVYHKAFGVSDLKSGKAMQTDSMFRMYSMTKVLASFLAARFYEERARRRIGIDS